MYTFNVSYKSFPCLSVPNSECDDLASLTLLLGCFHINCGWILDWISRLLSAEPANSSNERVARIFLKINTLTIKNSWYAPLESLPRIFIIFNHGVLNLKASQTRTYVNFIKAGWFWLFRSRCIVTSKRKLYSVTFLTLFGERSGKDHLQNFFLEPKRVENIVTIDIKFVIWLMKTEKRDKQTIKTYSFPNISKHQQERAHWIKSITILQKR